MSNFVTQDQTPLFTAKVGLDNIMLNEEEHTTHKQQSIRFTREENKFLTHG